MEELLLSRKREIKINNAIFEWLIDIATDKTKTVL